MNKSLWLLCFVSILCMPGCTTDVHPPPEQPTSDIFKCYTDPVPSGYLRVDSVDTSLPNCQTSPGDFHVYEYAPYTGLGSGSEMRICADDDLTAASAVGWELWSNPYRDAAGCDSETPRFTSDPNYKNVVIIKKT